MLNHLEQARLERAAQEEKQTEVDSVVVAIMKDNGQIVVYNIGDADGRKELYEAMEKACKTVMYEMNVRFMMHMEGGEE